jgi:hypothetical protein
VIRGLHSCEASSSAFADGNPTESRAACISRHHRHAYMLDITAASEATGDPVESVVRRRPIAAPFSGRQTSTDNAMVPFESSEMCTHSRTMRHKLPPLALQTGRAFTCLLQFSGKDRGGTQSRFALWPAQAPDGTPFLKCFPLAARADRSSCIQFFDRTSSECYGDPRHIWILSQPGPLTISFNILVAQPSSDMLLAHLSSVPVSPSNLPPTDLLRASPASRRSARFAPAGAA